MVYPVSWTYTVCYVTVITLFIKKVGVVRPNFLDALAMLARYMLWYCVRPSVRHNRYRIETAEQIQLVLGSKSSLNESYTVHVVRELGCRQTLGQGLLPSGILFHLNLADLGATVCKTVRPMLSDRCLSVCLCRWCIVAKRLDGLGCHLVRR